MSEQIRVRFAPSPTGYLHVGGARTALYNWLFARNQGGKFILRIEDTDLERSTAESETGLLADMKWLGLDYDEGPEVGGPYGPYRQSERRDIYQKAARRLLDNGTAYPCFCREEDLERKRAAAEAEHRSHHYDGTCRDLSAEERKRRLDAGEPYAIRLRVPERDYYVEDLIRGRVEWKAETLGDFIILRSNGMPVYNFCVVVDDSEMLISHVIRAEEHLTNTHRQLIIYEALGKKIPRFAHVSLILGEDKTKLSKRHGATSVGQYQQDGFLAEAMVNFLALLGWSEGNDQEHYSRQELVQKFSLERINKSPAVFDQVKLTWMNGQHLRQIPPATFGEMVRPVLAAAYPGHPVFADPVRWERLVALVQIGISRLNQAPEVARPILSGNPPENEEAEQTVRAEGVEKLFVALTAEFSRADWNKDGIGAAIKLAGKTAGAKGKGLFMPLRVKLTGNCHGPDLVGILEVIGREEAIRRLAS
jgi:glutamyl-tRNA synthetase